MSPDPVEQIARAVLYEGYMLWPYRRSALKNQQRFSFGGVYPRAFAEAWTERSAITMQCLLELPRSDAACGVEIALRFLRLVDRTPLHRGEPVDEVTAGGERHLAWQEGSEHELATGTMSLSELLAGRTVPFELPAGEDVEVLGGQEALRRSWQELCGELTLSATTVDERLLRLSVGLQNHSLWPGTERPPALARTFLSAHIVARARDGAFVSLTDPPAALEVHAASCNSDGLWPVLVGEPGQRDTLLAAPIILGDYPSVAPESPGDLYDGGEIDALLIHSLQGLTEAEREEIRATDPRLRELLDRSLGLPAERMRSLYGAVRSP